MTYSAGIFFTVESFCRANRNTGCVLTVATGDWIRNSKVGDILQVDTFLRSRFFSYSRKEVLALGMCDGTCNLTGATAQATFGPNNYVFHYKSSLLGQTQRLSFSVNVLKHQVCGFKGIRLNCKTCSYYTVQASCQKGRNSLTSKNSRKSTEHGKYT
jgi:hypothetical protein